MTNYRKRKTLKKRAGILVVFLVVIVPIFIFFKIGHTFSLVSDGEGWETSTIEDDNYTEENRTDILILGIRGEDTTEEYGNTLADTIMLLSIKTDTEELALVSLPRDLYAKIPRHANMREKINFAYAFGENKGIGGMNLTKAVVENVTGVIIDYAVVVDFKTFEDLINAVGGIDIYLEEEFIEKTQWGWEFTLPAGENTLDGETALYYARSRFSSNDFDRARRQQEIIVALKDKMLSTGVLTNPIKLNDIFNSIGKGVKTNINFSTALSLLKYVSLMDEEHLTKKVLSTFEGGLLQAGTIDDIYVLYPQAGLDNFSEIKKEIRGIFE